MIRCLLVDDHPALSAGLTAVLRAEPGMTPLGTAASEEELWPALARTRPDVVVLDYHLPPADGLHVCRRIKREPPAPAVLLYSAYADASLVVPAVLAGADGLVNKGAPAADLFNAIRLVARGDTVLPPVSRELVDEAIKRIDPEDVPTFSMALSGTPARDIADALRVAEERVWQAIDRILSRLKIDVATPRQV